MTRIESAVALALILGSTLVGSFCPPAVSMDRGQYAQVSPEIRDFFNSLKSKNGIPCCSTSDGKRVDDADWDSSGDHYRVRIDGEWYDVPPEAVIDMPNKFGGAVVWPVPQYEGAPKKYFIRCFLKGTEV